MGVRKFKANQSISALWGWYAFDSFDPIQSMNGSGGWTDSIKRWWVNVFSSSPQLGTSIKSETSTQMIVLKLTGIFHPSTFCSECSKNVVFVFCENYRKRALNILASGSLMAPCGVTCMPFQYWTLDPQLFMQTSIADGQPCPMCGPVGLWWNVWHFWIFPIHHWMLYSHTPLEFGMVPHQWHPKEHFF